MDKPRLKILRHSLNGETWCLIPILELEVNEEFVVFRICAGTNWLIACDKYNNRVPLGVDSWDLKESIWSGRDLTYLVPFSRWHGIGILSNNLENEEFYINFQTPIKRKCWGYETMDLELDIKIDSHGKKEFKDKREFELLKCKGFFEKHEIDINNIDVKQSIKDFRKFRSNIEEKLTIERPYPSLIDCCSDLGCENVKELCRKVEYESDYYM